ncbi:hypothetical protein M758_7G151700 [Ceratodon purpureus]|nr:hypothetical protein M758_7G151700 [Ceratodon purpureus]
MGLTKFRFLPRFYGCWSFPEKFLRQTFSVLRIQKLQYLQRLYLGDSMWLYRSGHIHKNEAGYALLSKRCCTKTCFGLGMQIMHFCQPTSFRLALKYASVSSNVASARSDQSLIEVK